MSTSTSWNDLLYPGEAKDFFSGAFPPFDPTTSRYLSGNALWLAELSRLVYRNPPLPLPTGNAFPAGTTCLRHRFFNATETDTQALLIEFGGAAQFAVLAFRGTEQKSRDITTDLKFGKIMLGGTSIEVHRGFNQALDSVWQQIEAELDGLTCPVFFTGHSLGAALATLAAGRRLRHPPQALYTFGSPRVGDRDFAAALNGIAALNHRVVDDEDIVALVPPEQLGFAHTGTQHQLTGPRVNPVLDWLLKWQRPIKPLADHAPINYVKRIRATLP